MVTSDSFAKKALTFEEVTELPHFNKSSFRVGGKIFASLNVAEQIAMVKLPLIEQSVFCSHDKANIYPATGAWGRQGCTMINLAAVKAAIVQDALTVAYCHIAPEKLANKYKGRFKL